MCKWGWGRSRKWRGVCLDGHALRFGLGNLHRNASCVAFGTRAQPQFCFSDVPHDIPTKIDIIARRRPQPAATFDYAAPALPDDTLPYRVAWRWFGKAHPQRHIVAVAM